MNRDGLIEATLWTTFAGTILAAVLVLGGTDAIADRAEAWLTNALRQPIARVLTDTALGNCNQPVDVEQLHIIVRRVDGRLIAQCMHVGSTGTYSRREPRS